MTPVGISILHVSGGHARDRILPTRKALRDIFVFLFGKLDKAWFKVMPNLMAAAGRMLAIEYEAGGRPANESPCRNSHMTALPIIGGKVLTIYPHNATGYMLAMFTE